MQTQQLKDKLSESLRQLDARAESDPALRSLLASLEQDLHETLAEHEPDQPAGGLNERLRLVAVDFAARHPKLEPVLERLVNMLSNLGI